MKCVIDSRKITDYLLKIDHPDGGPKAKFFLAGGFIPNDPDKLIQALKTHFDTNRATEIFLDRNRCVRIVVTAPMPAPNGRTPVVTSIWNIEDQNQDPRFVTAYPADR